MDAKITPKQSYRHTLKEISVNRHDACEVIRELISNAYDAAATDVKIFPLYQCEGFIVTDDGTGISMEALPRASGDSVIPYQAFFSIGYGTKTQGEGIGYKCQGSKLCFAAKRFTLLTKCKGEKAWRIISIENPKERLTEDYDLSPAQTERPWEELRHTLNAADVRTKAVLEQLGESYFTHANHGTIILVEGFQVASFAKFFSTDNTQTSYLYNYIRYYTAHGDTRAIAPEQGFDESDVNSVRSTIPRKVAPKLSLWMNQDTDNPIADIPHGWPYALAANADKITPPHEVSQLRHGRFWARHAKAIRHNNRYFCFILAVDGNRRSVDHFKALSTQGRRSEHQCGIKLADQRGVILSCQGVRICNYTQLFEEAALREWNCLAGNGTDHYTLVIDGAFDVVTNRNMLAEEAIGILRDSEFLRHLHAFLEESRDSLHSEVFRSLVVRLKDEAVIQDQNQYEAKHRQLKGRLKYRERFCIQSIPQLDGKWLLAPLPGEEHFVGALYTMFSHLVPPTNSLAQHWNRSLTFSATGLDAVAVGEEEKFLDDTSLLSVEYKYWLRITDEFNHPLSITDRVICWDFDPPNLAQQLRDCFGNFGEVTSILTHEGIPIGFELSNIQNLTTAKAVNRTVWILGLKRLLTATFAAKWVSPPPPPPSQKKKKK